MSYALFIPDVNKAPKVILPLNAEWRDCARVSLQLVLNMEYQKHRCGNESDF